MSSVQDIEKCKCGGKAYVDFDLRTSEEDKFCSHCGYTFEHLLNRDEHGNPTDGNYQTTIQDGYGSLFISYITDDFRIRCFHEPISGEIVEKFFNEINHNPLIDKKNSYLLRYENNQLTSIFGEIPEMYDAFRKRMEAMEAFPW